MHIYLGCILWVLDTSDGCVDYILVCNTDVILCHNNSHFQIFSCKHHLDHKILVDQSHFSKAHKLLLFCHKLIYPKNTRMSFFKNLYDEQKQKLTGNFVNKPGATGYSCWHCLLSEQSTILINWYLLPYGLVFSAQNLVTVVLRLIHITFW